MKANSHLWAFVLATDQKKHAHQWWLMGTRAKITWKTESCKTSDTLHIDPRPHRTDDQTPSLQERTWSSVQEAYNTLRNEYAHAVGNKTVQMFGSFGLCIKYIFLLNGQNSGNILTYNTPSQLYNKPRIQKIDWEPPCCELRTLW